MTNHVHVAMDGEQAMQFLRREARYLDAPRPDLILLDLNMPKKDGHEVLAEIKQDPTLQKIPVVVLTGSIAEEDMSRAYSLKCDHYINKPVNVDDFVKVVEIIESFWMTIVRLPPQDRNGVPQDIQRRTEGSQRG